MSIDKIAKDFDRVECAIFDLFADDVNENGEPIISDSDTLDTFIEIVDIMSRIESARIKAVKRENESIL